MVANPHKNRSIVDDIPSDWDLPEGWVETTLEQLLYTLESGSRPKGGVREIKGGVPSIGGEHLDNNGGFRFGAIKFVPKNFFEKMNRGRIQIGDILIVKDGATTGKVALVRDNFPHNPAVVNEHVFICRPAHGVYPPFIFYFLFSRAGQDRILENFRGSAQGGVNQSFAPGTTIPLAPLSEQKRIVMKLEQLLAQVNAAKKRLATVSLILKRFRQAVLAAACSGQLTADWRNVNPNAETAQALIKRVHHNSQLRYEASCKLARVEESRTPMEPPSITTVSECLDGLQEIPKSWEWFRAGIFYQDARYGTSSKCDKRDEERVPVLRIPNILTGQLELADLKYGNLSDLEFKNLTLQPGDIIICRTNGSLDLIGKAAIIPQLPRPHAFASYLIRVRFEPDSLLPAYFHICLSSKIGRDYIEEKARSTAGQFNLNLDILRNLPIPVPPSLEQYEIVKRVENLFKIADMIERRVAATTSRVAKLTQAILVKAFRGELVPTEAELARREGRSYEPASVLLARINEEPKTVEDYKRGKAWKVKLQKRM
ncbi:MAG: restriction endonuclease subunit S [Candidatus Helarchaeota archaeon]|nr:restriction endonuclease subunit S [Candidatus Helarchaeota archaeon]